MFGEANDDEIISRMSITQSTVRIYSCSRPTFIRIGA